MRQRTAIVDVLRGWALLSVVLVNFAIFYYFDRVQRVPADDTLSQIAKLIVDISTGNAPPEEPGPAKNPAAVALGKLGGAKGGPARAAKLSPARRKAIAKKAATTRWQSKRDA